MSGDKELETFRRFFANMETGDLMKGFLKSMEGKPTPKKLEILIATLKNFDYLYRGKSEKVRKKVRSRMMGAMGYLLSREEGRKKAREKVTAHKVGLRKLRLGQIKEDEDNLEMERREELNKSDSRVVTVRAPSASTQNTSQASKRNASPGVTVRAPLASKRNASPESKRNASSGVTVRAPLASKLNASQASKQSDSPDVVTVLQPSSLSEEALENVRKAQRSDHEQEEEKTSCYSVQCPFMGGNKSRKTRRIRKTKKYKKRKTRKNTKKHKTNQKRKTRGGKKNKRKKKQTRKR